MTDTPTGASAPTTAAGRALVSIVADRNVGHLPGPFADSIARIEREAAAAAIARVRAGIVSDVISHRQRGKVTERRRILAILAAAAAADAAPEEGT